MASKAVQHSKGFVVGDYRSNGRELGRGMSGTVYEGFHKHTEQRVAIKVINISKLVRETNPRAREYLNKEIAIMKSANHENVLKLYAHYISMNGDFVYLVMEVCNAGDLAQFLRAPENKPLSEALTQDLIQQFAAGLRCLRYMSVVHRDLKPQNLMLSSVDPAYLRQHPGRRFKLTIVDFGLARQISAQSVVVSIVGSPRYMAPEVLESYASTSRSPYTVSADLWSVGVIMFEMLMGSPPFAQANTPGALLTEIRRTTSVAIPRERELSGGCCDLLRSLLQRDPEKRISWTKFFAHPWLALPPLECPPSVDIDKDIAEPSPVRPSDESARGAGTPVTVYPHEPKPPSPSPTDAAYRSSPDILDNPSDSVSLLTGDIRAPSVNPFRDAASRDTPAPVERPSSRASEDSFERGMVIVRSGESGQQNPCTPDEFARLERLATGGAAMCRIGYDHMRTGQTAKCLCSYRLGLHSLESLLKSIDIYMNTTPEYSEMRHGLISRAYLIYVFVSFANMLRCSVCIIERQCWVMFVFIHIVLFFQISCKSCVNATRNW
eukprot:TRINITY_DN1727_c0_g1_i2.p1 TRINITY_DN1727_c0_g1~~TRINITY_DN1727_c0_g1_i2.p1  ORF type:complete len:550 (+),score=80.17 TRINITY_DN1727_c0_g1_i2:241-1890(+)